jgi:hypothetical protein
MRTFFAFILGIAVTIGGTYLYDKVFAGWSGATTKPMVNWDVVQENARMAAESAQAQWSKLTSK